MVAVFHQKPVAVEGFAIVEVADAAGVGCRARKGVGRVNLWIVVCPATRGHREGTKLNVVLAGGGIHAIDCLIAFDALHLVDNLVQQVQDVVVDGEEVDDLGNDAREQLDGRDHEGLDEQLAC